jgi:cytochrome c oxidase subunit 1
MKSGPKVEANPWKSKSLEWMTESNPLAENFPVEPVVISGTYDYDVDGVAAIIPNPAG